jgi:hypothetical protein
VGDDTTVGEFEREGLVVLPGRLPAALVAALRDAALRSLDATLGRIRTIRPAGLGVGMDEGFAQIVQRAPGRFDLIAGTDEPPFTDPAIQDRAPWRTIVARLLGEDARQLYRGILVAQPGSAQQPWHADGEQLFSRPVLRLPVHCVNVFVPLVDLTDDNGPTEFCPRTHHLGGDVESMFEQDPDLLRRIGYDGTPMTPLLGAGSMLLFDYRLVHRGLANRSPVPRPLLYLTYARPWFRDARSFPERSL